MTAADTNLRSKAAQQRFSMFVRAVFARLGAGALAAWAGAWAAVMITPVRETLFLVRGETAIAVTPSGVAAMLAPLLVWAAARVYLRRVGAGGATFYWLFAFSAGLGLNTAFFGFTSNSLASVFAIAALCLLALNLLTRVLVRAPGVVAIVLVVGVLGEGLALAMDRVLTHWDYVGVDAMAAPLLALLLSAGLAGLSRLWAEQAVAARWNELVDCAALSVLTLTQAPPRPDQTFASISRGASDADRAPRAHDAPQRASTRSSLQFEDQT